MHCKPTRCRHEAKPETKLETIRMGFAANTLARTTLATSGHPLDTSSAPEPERPPSHAEGAAASMTAGGSSCHFFLVEGARNPKYGLVQGDGPPDGCGIKQRLHKRRRFASSGQLMPFPLQLPLWKARHRALPCLFCVWRPVSSLEPRIVWPGGGGGTGRLRLGSTSSTG